MARERILKKRQSPFRQLRRLSLGRLMMKKSSEWAMTKAAVEVLRSARRGMDAGPIRQMFEETLRHTHDEG